MQGACSDLSSSSINPLSRSPNLHILHYNARSLYPKFDELCAIYVTWKNLTLYVSLKHGSVMTSPKLNAPFMDTDVLDVTETDMVEELLCLYPTN